MLAITRQPKFRKDAMSPTGHTTKLLLPDGTQIVVAVVSYKSGRVKLSFDMPAAVRLVRDDAVKVTR